MIDLHRKLRMQILISLLPHERLTREVPPRSAPVPDDSLCIECSLHKVLYYISVFFPKLCKVLWKLGFTLSPIATEVKDFFNGVARDALKNRKADKDQVGIKNKYYIHCTSTYCHARHF